MSLIEGESHGLPVPAFFILPVSFFVSWTQQLKKSKEWAGFLKAKDEDLQKACDALKHAALRSAFTSEQEGELQKNLEMLADDQLLAVRSSSPEEDLEGSSFAGGYETILGVTREKLRSAIHKAFVSCLDYRVVIYKRENGFSVTDPKIAVIVQKQIASEIAGVGFSLDPVTNDYDTAVFNANWGLGETVVAGLSTPDTYIVDKVHLEIKKKTIGTKELSIWLKPKGGTEEKHNFKNEERALSDKQVISLTELIKKVERYYEKPMDIEWAFKNDQLFLLQARPITTYVPLSPEMITNIGQHKRLYLDVTVTAQGMNQPVSKMGTSVFCRLLKIIGKIIAGRDITQDIDRTVGWISDGRIFVNLSNAFALAGKKRVVHVLSIMDPLGARTIASLSEKIYKSPTPKEFLLPLAILWRLPGILFFIRQALHSPDRVHRKVQESLKAFEQEAKDIALKDMPLQQFIDELIYKMFMQVFRKAVPLVLVSRIILGKMKKAAGDNPEIDKLELALPHNVTTEMGLALSHVAELLPQDLTKEQFAKKLEKKELPEEFMSAWQSFLEQYGHRGPSEIDVAAPRYRDDSALILDLLLTMKNSKGESAQEKFERNQTERQGVYELFYQKLLADNAHVGRRFAKHYHFFETFGGYRETHKYYLVLVVAILREKILTQAATLVAEKRLDSVEQVFDLTIEQLDQARVDTSIDLRKLAFSNTVFLKKLARVTRPPSLIDSRGFIPSPPTLAHRKGEYVGIAISQGVVQGRIKVLHTPSEKPLEKGEILVARSTDPGWTPLFVNAAGLILEIGGLLQHGALVAREYGLPCVAGIMNATEIWKDGTLVEVDGTSGIVRTIEENPKS